MQTLIVIAIILTAVIYAGMMMLKKIGSFSPKADCGGGCGCGKKSHHS